MLKPNVGLLTAIILVVLLLVPFSNKAFNNDDPLVIYGARQIIRSPLCAFDASINWYGVPETFRYHSNPPFIYYYAAFIIKLTGENEIWMHILFLIFPIIAVISMYFLAKRFSDNSILSLLLFISMPAFLVTATNLMPDTALLALFLASVTTFVYGMDKENILLLVLSGILMGLASLTKYTGLILPFLLLFYSLLKKKKFHKVFFSFLPFIFIFELWCLYNFIYFHKLHIFEVISAEFNPNSFGFLNNAVATLIYTGSTVIFPLLFLLLIQNKKDGFMYLLIIWISIIVSIEWLMKSGYALAQRFLVVFFISTALIVCKKFIDSLKEERASGYTDMAFLLVWFSAIFCYNIFVVTWFAAVRYTLILTPPIILMFMKRYNALVFNNRNGIFKRCVRIAIILNLVFSVLINCADYIYAGVYRDFTKTYAKHLKEKNVNVWFRGHGWLQYYMEREGFTYLALGDIPGKNEIIIIPSVCPYEPLSEKLGEGLKFIGTIKYETAYPLRTVSPKDKIGFHFNSAGLLPYGVSSEPLEVLQIWRVK